MSWPITYNGILVSPKQGREKQSFIKGVKCTVKTVLSGLHRRGTFSSVDITGPVLVDRKRTCNFIDWSLPHVRVSILCSQLKAKHPGRYQDLPKPGSRKARSHGPLPFTTPSIHISRTAALCLESFSQRPNTSSFSTLKPVSDATSVVSSIFLAIGIF